MYYRNDPSEYSLRMRTPSSAYILHVDPTACGFLTKFTAEVLDTFQAIQTRLWSFSLSSLCCVCMWV